MGIVGGSHSPLRHAAPLCIYPSEILSKCYSRVHGEIGLQILLALTGG
jgi:hypothetical protein